MHALKPSTLPLQPVRRSRTVPHAKVSTRRYPYRSIVIEVGVKLTVNLLVSAVAVATVAQLLPYRSSQEARLQELQVAVKSTGERVQQVKSSFTQYFDPAQSKVIMEQQTNRIDPQQRQIVLQGLNRQ